MKNTIYLRRKSKVVVKSEKDNLPVHYLCTMLKNVENLGFVFSAKLIETLLTLSETKALSFYRQIVKDLRNMVGANVKYKPMYPNFPEQVMEADEAELYINAIMHYLGDVIGARIMPVYEENERPELLEKTKLKVIDLGTEDEFRQICTNLLRANSSLSTTDKEDVEWFVTHYKDVLESLMPEEIPYKENLVHFTQLLLNHTNKANIVVSKFKTATDVLRLAVALSGGDISLAEKSRFKKFKRSERKLLLSMLENSGSITEDMLRYKLRWVRLGEILHPSEYSRRFPKTHEAFNTLRNDLPFDTFNSKVERYLVNGNPVQVANLLKSRPGEFARRLDHVLRLVKGNKHDSILDTFGQVLGKVSTPVVLQVMEHFKYRSDGSKFMFIFDRESQKRKPVRAIFPKGNVAKVMTVPNELPKLDHKICKRVVELCENSLVSRFKELDLLGNVYLDERMSDYLVPFSQRSASKALHTIVRGSKLRLTEEDKDTIRFFIWWKGGNVSEGHTCRVDLDLSAVMFNEKWEMVEHIAYTNLRSEKYKACHSGDITSAPKGASEFIDLDIPSTIKYGGRYIVMSVNSYTCQPFVTLPECYAGWMMRENPGSGEIFEPKTVENKIDVTANTQITIPIVIDVVERCVYWCDIALTRNPDFCNSAYNNRGSMGLMCQAIVNLVKPNLYELFKLHTEARGTLVDSLEEADVIFSPERLVDVEGLKEDVKIVTPFDDDEIMGNYIQ